MARIFCDRARIRARARQAEQHMMYPLSSQILQDCNYFCRQDQGGLIDSSLTASDPSRGMLVWDTDYARKTYYTGTPSKDVNANASLQWCEKAKAAYNKDWAKVAQASFIEGMRQ